MLGFIASAGPIGFVLPLLQVKQHQQECYLPDAVNQRNQCDG